MPPLAATSERPERRRHRGSSKQMLESMARNEAARRVPYSVIGRFGDLRGGIEHDDPQPGDRIATIAAEYEQHGERDEASELQQRIEREIAGRFPVKDARDPGERQNSEHPSTDRFADPLRDCRAEYAGEDDRHRQPIPEER